VRYSANADLAGKPILAQRTLLPVLIDITGGAMPIHVIWQKTSLRMTVDALVRLAAVESAVFTST
jgi:hypothetical protein